MTANPAGASRPNSRTGLTRPTSAPPARSSPAPSFNSYASSPSPHEAFLVISKQFDFGTSALNEIGTAAGGGDDAAMVMTKIVTSRLPTTYNPVDGPIVRAAMGSGGGGGASSTPQHHTNMVVGNSSSAGHVHRIGGSTLRGTFFEANAAQRDVSVPGKRNPNAEVDVTAHQKQILAHSVAERLVDVHEHRKTIQRRIRPQSAQVLSKGGNDNASLLGGATHYSTRPAPATEGFDIRTSVLRAAQSACLNAAPAAMAATSARKPFGEGEVQHFQLSPTRHAPYPVPPGPLTDANAPEAAPDHDDGTASLLLRHRRTEMMLAADNVPLVGSGLRALLLASEQNVQAVASGVMVIAQVLGADIAAAQHTMKAGGPTVPTAPVYKDVAGGSSGGGESWRIVYAGQRQEGGGFSPTRQAGNPNNATDGSTVAGGRVLAGVSTTLPFAADGVSLMPPGEILNGSAVRIRGRPHSAPIGRYDDDGRPQQKPPVDYLAQLRAVNAATTATHVGKSLNNNNQRPASAQPLRSSKLQHSVAAPTKSVFLMDPRSDAAKPTAPEWLDQRGLIGVSMDPRYSSYGDAAAGGGREGFGLFGGSADPGASAGGRERHHDGRTGSFNTRTALSAIRAARVQRDAAATALRRGVLRGGAGFLMFSPATAAAHGGGAL